MLSFRPQLRENYDAKKVRNSQPDEEKNWERQFLYLWTAALIVKSRIPIVKSAVFERN